MARRGSSGGGKRCACLGMKDSGARQTMSAGDNTLSRAGLKHTFRK